MNRWLLVAVMRAPRKGLVRPMPTKESYELMNAVEEIGIDLMELSRYHSDGGKEMKGHLKKALKKALVRMTDTGGYDSAANGLVENLLQMLTRMARCLLRQAGLPVELWDFAFVHANEILVRRKRKSPDMMRRWSP